YISTSCQIGIRLSLNEKKHIEGKSDGNKIRRINGVRKYVIIFSLICLAFISACETATNVDHDNEKEKAPIIQTEGKPEMDKATLEEDALFRFEGEVDGAKFFAYFFAENQAEKSLEKTSFFGQEGDPVVSGEYDFYLAEKNSDVAYKQTQLDSLDMKFN